MSALLLALALAVPVTETAAELRERPTPPDLGSLLRDVPGLVPDRTGVGPSEIGLQPNLVGHGDAGSGATFVLDGVDVTDVAAPGTSSLQIDLDALESLSVETIAFDVRQRTAGPRVEMSLRAPSPGTHGAVHVRSAQHAWQSDNLADELRGRPPLRNVLQSAYEAGAELSGHPVPRLWLFGAASRDQLQQQTATRHGERVRSDSLLARARLDAAPWQAGLLVGRTEKDHADRDPVLSASHDSRWHQSGPAWLMAADVTRGRSRLRASRLDSDVRFDPYGGASSGTREDLRGFYQGSYVAVRQERSRAALDVERDGGRGRHRWLAGVGLERREARTRTTWPGDKVLALERQSVFFRTFQLSGFALPVRDQDAHARVDGLHALLQDELRIGPVDVRAGVRVERLRGRALEAAVAANPAFPELLPAVATPGGGTGVHWTDVLPRALLTYEPDAWRFTAGWARYAAPLPVLDAAFDQALAREASVVFYWRDLDGDQAVDRGELDESYGRVGANNLDPADPGSSETPQRIDAEVRAPLTSETVLGMGRSLGGAARMDLVGGWRRLTRATWRPLRDLTTADYVARGAVRGELFDDAYSVVYYAATGGVTASQGRLIANRPAYRQDALWLDLVASGRAARLDWRAFVSFTDWREFFMDRALAVQDPTPTDTEPLVDAGPVAVRAGGLGRGDVFVNARWTAGLSGGARLPWSLRGSVRAWAREGFPVPYVQLANTGDPTAGTKAVLVAPSLTAYRLPAVLLVDAGLRRIFGPVTAGVDVFNLLNRGTRLQGERDVEVPGLDRPRELLRPRIVRVGLAYRF